MAFDVNKVDPGNPAPEELTALEQDAWAKDEGHAQDIFWFIEWLTEECGLTLCEPSQQPTERMVPVRTEPIALIRRYFGIDPQALENERRQLLEHLRENPPVPTVERTNHS